MPPKGDPLTFTEQELIRKWIAQGIDFGTWLGSEDGVREPINETDGPIHDLPDYLRFYDHLALGLEPIKASLIEELNLGEALLIRPIGIGNPLIEVRVVTDADNIDDQSVAQLSLLQNYITLLDLRGSMITDKSGELISKFKKITKLNLRGTKIGDEGIKHFIKLPNLQSLNLSGTEVTDDGFKALNSLSSLKSLYLWGSRVSEDGVSRFTKGNPLVELNF
jgi:Leucine-rich repeat (LRR) protein